MYQHFTLSPVFPFLEIRTTLKSDVPYTAHIHSHFSLGLILGGRVQFRLGESIQEAEPGDIVLIAPRQAHSCNPAGGAPRSYHMAHIDAGWFHEHLGMTLHGKQGLRIATPRIRDAELFAQAHRLIHAVRCAPDDPADPEAGLEALLTRLHLRYQCFPSATDFSAENTFLPDENSLRTRIREGRCSVSDLASIAGVRRETFSRAFRRFAGLPPWHYLHCLRVEYGRNLIRKGSGIAEAAMAAGYADQSHFHRMFVRYCSVTPGRYRKNRAHSSKK